MQTTIESISLANWQGTSNVSLQICCDRSFVGSSGAIIQKSSDRTFFTLQACSISGTTLTIPAITIESTVDSVSNPYALYTAYFYDAALCERLTMFGGCSFPVPATTTTTWATIFSEVNND